MDYTNEHGVKFKLVHRGTNTYTVRYYPGNGRAWPRTYRMFLCPTDECRREMFYILNHSRLCTICKDDLIEYRAEDNPIGRGCILRKAQEDGRNEESIPECPVCYQQMLVVDPALRCVLCWHEVHALKVRVLQLVRQVRWRQHERVVHVVGQHVQPVGPEAELGRVRRLQRAEKVGGAVCHRALHRQPPHSHLQQHQ